MQEENQKKKVKLSDNKDIINNKEEHSKTIRKITIREYSLSNNQVQWDLTHQYLHSFLPEENDFSLQINSSLEEKKEIVEFYASHNFLSDIPNEVVILQKNIFTEKLVKLNLSCNNLTKFPNLKNLINLKELILSNNKLTEINEENLQYLNNLQKLDLKLNQIKEIKYLPNINNNNTNNLTYLSLSCNKLQSLNLNELTKCKKLKHLGLFGNLLKELNILNNNFNEMLDLWIDGNPIFETNVKMVDVSFIRYLNNSNELSFVMKGGKEVKNVVELVTEEVKEKIVECLNEFKELKFLNGKLIERK
ncbi:hypothetical protein ABK040_012288 [Willaertia magna]